MHCRNGFEWISPDATVGTQITSCGGRPRGVLSFGAIEAIHAQESICSTSNQRVPTPKECRRFTLDLICPPTGLTDAIIVRGDLEPGVRETRAKAQVVRKSGAGGSEYQH